MIFVLKNTIKYLFYATLQVMSGTSSPAAVTVSRARRRWPRARAPSQPPWPAIPTRTPTTSPTLPARRWATIRAQLRVYAYTVRDTLELYVHDIVRLSSRLGHNTPCYRTYLPQTRAMQLRHFRLRFMTEAMINCFIYVLPDKT